MLLNTFQIPKGHSHLLQNNSFESDLFFLLIVGVEGYCCNWFTQ